MQNFNWKERINWTVFILSGGLLLLFVVMSFLFTDGVAAFVNWGFDKSITYFGAFWQVLLLATFAVGAVLAISKYGKVRLGNTSRPSMSFFKWASIITVSGLGAGGIFWAAAEPMYYFMEVPPMHNGITAGTEEATDVAMAQSFMSWGFTAWAVYGAITAIIIMYAHYNKGLSLKPRTLLYPIFGKKVEQNAWGVATDVFCIIGAVAGTIGTIGFFGFQFSYWMHDLFGIPDVLLTQILAVGGLITLVTISTVTGIEKGIQFLSRFNVWFAIAIGVIMLIIGPGGFIIDTFISSYGTYVEEFMNIHTFRGDNGWLGFWMIFFFGWFIGFGPLMAILVARISRGRTIREVFFVVSIVTALSSNVWFSTLGGSGIFYELQNTGSVSEPLMENGLPAAIIAIAGQLPMGGLMAIVFLLLTITFVITTADSMSYSVSMAVTGEGDPPKGVRIFWAVLMGAISVVLINIGEGSISALQSFIVVTAVPISIIMLPVLWTAPKLAKTMAIEQGIIEKENTSYSSNNVSEKVENL
ncbi:BCCT family transporter [Alteribacillus bidgolensis]|uniref:Choline-glycine betaine transporter n=1 Tax=Alteribacillus bidgolensis TaxID=930129 RepID=A0A1G8R0N3_9BACI|nr:BCCT family transporter [Alteribacillus bidgolensis]SDJ10125.1 Choline-glycine betaine transporter [Alteribacillus bidgolensis]